MSCQNASISATRSTEIRITSASVRAPRALLARRIASSSTKKDFLLSFSGLVMAATRSQVRRRSLSVCIQNNSSRHTRPAMAASTVLQSPEGVARQSEIEPTVACIRRGTPRLPTRSTGARPLTHPPAIRSVPARGLKTRGALGSRGSDAPRNFPQTSRRISPARAFSRTGRVERSDRRGGSTMSLVIITHPVKPPRA